jgi:hypothetical protein
MIQMVGESVHAAIYLLAAYGGTQMTIPGVTDFLYKKLSLVSMSHH